MALGEKLLFRQALQRSAREWLNIYREVLKEERPHGLGSDFRPKSTFSPVNANSVASGNILDAGYEIQKGPDGYEILIGLPGYILAIDGGVRPKGFEKRRRGAGGTSLFLKSLQDWIETKKISTDNTLSLAFAIRTNIFKRGIAATNILSTINERFTEKFEQEIADEYFIDMENYIITEMQRLEDRFR